MSYSTISEIGSDVPLEINNPLSYCMTEGMENGFLHGGSANTLGKNGRSCQLFMSEYCATKWDNFCEVASHDTNTLYPNTIGNCMGYSDVACKGLNSGEVLIKNTAARKYLNKMIGSKKQYEPFDPNVATSPLISYWIPDNGCGSQCQGVPVYIVDYKTINKDPVMNRILAKPIIAFDILVNIYNTMKRLGRLTELKGTKIGLFFSVNPYFKSKGGMV